MGRTHGFFFLAEEMVKPEVTGIRQRFKRARIGLKDALAVIDMTLDDQLRDLVTTSPDAIFEVLDRLIDRTAHGTRIERSRPKKSDQPFHTFEIHTKRGEVLGYLNMIYFRKPIPCYYLVYVEVLLSFRGRGLGHRILTAFREFVEDKGTVGVLDNIIPLEDPTYSIYTKHGWKRIETLIGDGMVNGEGHYMVFVPPGVKPPDLRRLTRLLFRIKKKRPVIDMHDNESMVKRTIAEFRSVYEALERLFETELSAGTSTPLMRFMFTRFVTKVLGFRRRISTLLGYTGGESLEQISISGPVRTLPIQPYSLWEAKDPQPEIRGEEGIIRDLPQRLKREPTRYIESLPLYSRPYLSSWTETRGKERSSDFRISDLLTLGFDPTKLRTFRIKEVDYVFERVSPRFLPSLERKKELLLRIREAASGMRFRGATIQVNPPLATFRDRANVYILRRKVGGIHADEALDHLRTSSYLKEMNRAAQLDKAILATISAIENWLVKGCDSRLPGEIEDLVFFVPWNFERNSPRFTVDVSGVFLDLLWVA
jgi:GNAT superfamily N-acetyltransferase